MYIQGISEGASGRVDDTGLATAEVAQEAELLMQSLSVKPTSTTLLVTGEPQTQIDRAARALVHEVVTGMRFFAQQEYRHGKNPVIL